MCGDDDARPQRFKSSAQIRVVPREVFDEPAGFDGATVSQKEVREVTDRFNVSRPHLHRQAISLFGFDGVVAFGEEIGLSDANFDQDLRVSGESEASGSESIRCVVVLQ